MSEPRLISHPQQFIEFLQVEKSAFAERYEKKKINNLTFDDFSFIRALGIGTFGKVDLASEKKTKKYYAMKILSKKRTVDLKQVEHTYNEKHIMQSLNFNFTVSLYAFFMDNSYLYFVMPFMAGGELFRLFHQEGPFSELQTRFYAGQILLALEYLHNFDIIYRDLKPENILIDKHGYLKLTDFGLSKVVSGRTYTMCGTPDYIAPEIILCKGYGKAVDFWALGVLMYELHIGYPPFFAPTLMRLYEAITKAKIIIPHEVNKDLTALLKGLITSNLTKRLGNLKNGIEDIKGHKWFQPVNWIALLNYKQKAPFIPEKTNPMHSTYFDPYLVNEELHVSSHDSYEFQFADF